MIKAILFDFDGVLTTDKTGSQSVLSYLAEQTGIPMQTLKNSYYRFNEQLLCGELTHRDIWQEFCEGVGRNIDDRLLTEAFRNTPLDEKMLSIVKSLKKKYMTGLITDNKADRIGEALSFFGISDLFDVASVSAQIGSGKDSEFIFKETLRRLGIEPKESVFIDNSERNLVIPRKLGMKVILFDDERRDTEQFLRELNQYL